MDSHADLTSALGSIGKRALRDIARLLDESYRDAFNRVQTEFTSDQHARILPGERKGIIERDMEQVAKKHKLSIEILTVQGGHALRIIGNKGAQGTFHYKKRKADELPKTRYRKRLATECEKNNPSIFQKDMLGKGDGAAYITFVHGIADGDRSCLGYFVAHLYDADHVLLADEDVLAYCQTKAQKLVEVTTQEQPRIVGLK